MKAVVLEKKGVINVREVPDTPAQASKASKSAIAWPWNPAFRT